MARAAREIAAARSDQPMDWRTMSAFWGVGDVGGNGHRPAPPPRRWIAHASHERGNTPHRVESRSRGEVGVVSESSSGSTPSPSPSTPPRLVTLDGSKGEGGGQILRTALTLSLLMGRPFRIVKIRANREKPGLRPQHMTAVASAAELGGAEVVGGSVG